MTDEEIRKRIEEHKVVVEFKRDHQVMMDMLADDLDRYLAKMGTAISSRAIVKAWLKGKYD